MTAAYAADYAAESAARYAAEYAAAYEGGGASGAGLGAAIGAAGDAVRRVTRNATQNVAQDGDGLAGGMAVSLLLHAAVAGSIWLAWHWTPAPRTPDRLMVELVGMVANRQTEKAQAGEKAPPLPKSPPKPQPKSQPPRPRAAERALARPEPPRHAAAPQPIKAQARQAEANSPVKVEEKPQAATPPPPPIAAAPPPPAAVAPPAPGTAQTQQINQTIRHDETDIDVQRRYLAALTKTIKGKLSYPPDGDGLTGTPTIAFNLSADGTIEPGSLKVRRSSGYSVLDNAALQAVRDAAPFSPPPKPMSLTLEMPFTEVQG